MPTRRSFLKSIAAAVASVPAVGLVRTESRDIEPGLIADKSYFSSPFRYISEHHYQCDCGSEVYRITATYDFNRDGSVADVNHVIAPC